MLNMAKTKCLAVLYGLAVGFSMLLASTTAQAVPPGGCTYFIKVTSPADGAIIVIPCGETIADIPLTADICCPTNPPLDHVDYYQGTTYIGSSYSFWTFPLTWTGVSPGTYSITAKAISTGNVVLGVSAPISITVNAPVTLTSPQMSGSSFLFTINGSSGATVDVQASSDLNTWSSLGSVTLSGSTYAYTDSGAGSLTARFYRGKQSDVCSCNAVGFEKETIVGGNSHYTPVANQLNNPSGNNLSILFASLAGKSKVLIWDMSSQTYVTYTKSVGGTWSPGNPALNPGHGAMVTTIPQSATVIFVGEVPQGSQVNSLFPSTSGQFSLLNSIYPRADTLDALGFPKRTGDQILKWNDPSQSWQVVSTYSGTSWDVVPSASVGESFFLLNSSTDVRSWTENFPLCQ
jgi:hypothetical protein